MRSSQTPIRDRPKRHRRKGHTMFMHRIKLQNILSFGPEVQVLELAPLNVLIGPNGSGKSNLLEVIGLLQAAPNDLTVPIRQGGGGDNWIWHGKPTNKSPLSRVEAVVGKYFKGQLLRYSLSFEPSFFGTPHLAEEIVEVLPSEEGKVSPERYLERHGSIITLTVRNRFEKAIQRDLPPTDVKYDQSILSQVKDPGQYPELTSLGHGFARIHLYRHWSFGPNAPPRLLQKADLPNHALAEDGHNLGMVLNRLERNPEAKTKLLAELRRLYCGIEDYFVQVEAGSVQVFLREGGITVPATRLSDGTLRYLCLLAILCQPSPPGLICIEEPELGLHPDILPSLADLLCETSERCQLIVTTHSDVLVDALTERPDSVVICEKVKGQTTLKRLNKDKLSHWLDKYRLGELWTSGELGGTRW